MTADRKRHIILEGPDGSGKSTLLYSVYAWMQLHQYGIHPKFSGPKGPDLSTLDWRTQEDLEVMTSQFNQPQIYDRHPIISEMVYGPIVRNSLTGWFNDPAWVGLARKILYKRSIVVWCLPEFYKCHRNVSHDRDMNGVVRNFPKIYKAYEQAAREWEGPKFIYDYTKGNTHTMFLGSYLHSHLNK